MPSINIIFNEFKVTPQSAIQEVSSFKFIGLLTLYCIFFDILITFRAAYE